jgi:hypothetical protein
MTRFLAIALVLVVLWLGWQNLKLRLRLGWTVRTAEMPGKPRAEVAETLVRCSACGTHVLRSRALAGGSELYCSEECRTLTPRPPLPNPPIPPRRERG